MKEIIAVDFGGTNLRVALVRENKIIKLIEGKTPKSKSKLLKDLVDYIEKLINKNVVGIGVSSPGPLKEGRILNSPNIPLKNFYLESFLKKKFKIKVLVENDANCVALAESKLGVKKDNFFVLTLGTGIGGGVVINGDVYNLRDIGAELGYIFIENGKTLEDLAGFKKVSMETKKAFGREIYVSELIKMKDKKSKKIIEDLSENVSKGIGSLINIFNPAVVVLTGGMTHSGDKLLSLIRKKSKKYILLPKKYDIRYSRLKEPGIIGASLLIKY